MGDHQYTLADLEDSFSLKEFAGLVHVSQRSVLRMITEGEIDAIRVTQRKYRIPKRAAETWMAGRPSTFPVPA